ncbi:hypothetical protein [Ralstonia insidiosa]|uniref:hypothetical protein n=1 Tax=Ralstonia insidiosa TaxID=190721 RepID=UPI000CEDA609|nr:hypothetical protein [Ralstonia insidiosa]
MRAILPLLICMAIPATAAYAEIDPYTAELARQADARIGRQNTEAQAQAAAIHRSNLNAGRCAELANDRNIIKEWLRTAGSDADRARFRTLMQVNQSDLVRYGC